MVGEVAGSHVVAAPMTKRAVSGAAIGNLLEWYDFSVYGYLAGTIGKLFFASTDATTQLLLSFSVFGVGFFMRPVGAIVIGHFGDKHGRKNALIFTVMAMAVGTVLIGLLPTYQSAGVSAAVLLTLARLIQGFSAGGEWGGSTAFLVEYAPAGQRGFIGSFQQVTTVGGLVLGSLVAWLLTVAFTDQQMLDWAWRLPFLLGIVIAPVGVYLRSKVEETPKYTEIERKQEVAKTPFLEMLERYPRETFTGFGFTLLWTVGFYIVLTYMPTYMRRQLSLPYSQSLFATLLGLILLAALIPVFGALSDRIGRRPLLIAACVLFAVGIYPMFSFIVAVHQFWAVVLNQLLWAIPLAFYSGAGPAAIAEIFPTKVRYVTLSTGYNIAVAIFGGFAPTIATYLIGATGNPLAPSFYVIAAAIASLITMIAIPETYNRPLK
jgi:MHS family proline/betaine transporter-like MFS transporter